MTENKATKMEEDNSDGDVHAQLDRLDESLNNYELAGIIGCSIGLFIYSRGQLLESQKHILR